MKAYLKAVLAGTLALSLNGCFEEEKMKEPVRSDFNNAYVVVFDQKHKTPSYVSFDKEEPVALHHSGIARFMKKGYENRFLHSKHSLELTTEMQKLVKEIAVREQELQYQMDKERYEKEKVKQ